MKNIKCSSNSRRKLYYLYVVTCYDEGLHSEAEINKENLSQIFYHSTCGMQNKTACLESYIPHTECNKDIMSGTRSAMVADLANYLPACQFKIGLLKNSGMQKPKKPGWFGRVASPVPTPRREFLRYLCNVDRNLLFCAVGTSKVVNSQLVFDLTFRMRTAKRQPFFKNTKL